MLRTLILSFFLLATAPLLAQTNYQKGMQKALQTWQEGNPSEAVNIFERIAAVETEKWIPNYYIAQLLIIESFNTKDIELLTAKLGKARDYLNDAKALSKDNPELMVLEAQWYTAWIAYDGQKYGMQYASKVEQIYKDALKIDPTNPRAAFGKIEWEMGAARFWGQEIAPFCAKLSEAYKLYDTFSSDELFYPSHGKEYGAQVIEQNCNQ